MKTNARDGGRKYGVAWRHEQTTPVLGITVILLFAVGAVHVLSWQSMTTSLALLGRLEATTSAIIATRWQNAHLGYPTYTKWMIRIMQVANTDNCVLHKKTGSDFCWNRKGFNTHIIWLNLVIDWNMEPTQSKNMRTMAQWTRQECPCHPHWGARADPKIVALSAGKEGHCIPGPRKQMSPLKCACCDSKQAKICKNDLYW